METNNWEQQVIQKFLLATIEEQRRSRRWKIFFRLVWLFLFLGIIMFYLFSGKSSISTMQKQVAVINLKGEISDSAKTYETLYDGLDEALKDNHTVGIIIRANSPGGSPVYSNMLYNEILRFKRAYPNKPIEVVIEEVCASGCYYIAAAADKIYANPSSIVGSIGVIYPGFGATGLMQKIGIDSRLLISGKNKAMGYPFINANESQTIMQQQMLDEIHQQFITAVTIGRGKRLNTNDPDLFSGRYWIGTDSLKLGLIDGFATVDSLARDQFKTDNIVDYTPKQDPIERLAKKFGVNLIDSAKQALSISEFSNFK